MFAVKKALEKWTCANEGKSVNEWQPNLTHVVFKCGSFVPGRRRGHEKADGILLFCWAADCKEQFKQYLKGMLVSFIYVLLLLACSRVPDGFRANVLKLENEQLLTFALTMKESSLSEICGGWGSWCST